MSITIFTPTYNRAHTLGRLYHSLVKQTCNNFKWLIIDDGSTDNTKELIDTWKQEKKINIKYYKQKNQGKSMAHNKGVEMTSTNLFTCVDSDDFLHKEAVERILKLWEKESSSDTVGILAYCAYSSGERITKIKNNKIQQFKLKDAYRKHGLTGDTMLIYKHSIISNFKFPKFEYEKFVPESYLYDLIDQEGDLILLDQPLYYVEYLDDGYSNNMAKIILDNPNGYIAYINQRLKMEKSLKYKSLDTIRYVAISIASNKENIISDAIYPRLTRLLYSFGYMFYVIRYKKYNYIK